MVYLKKIEKLTFIFFFVKIFADLISSITNFSNLCKEIQKLSCSVLWKRFEIKSQQRRAHYLKLNRKGRQIPTGGAPCPPPPRHTHWLGLKRLIKKVKVCIDKKFAILYSVDQKVIALQIDSHSKRFLLKQVPRKLELGENTKNVQGTKNIVQEILAIADKDLKSIDQIHKYFQLKILKNHQK